MTVASTKAPPARLGTVVRYLALGGLAAAVNWGSRFAWSRIMPFSAAVVVAYMTGMLVAFLLFRAYVFPGSVTPLRQQVRNFVLVNLLGIAQTWIIAMLLVDKLFPAIGFKLYPEAIGHGLAIAAPVVTSWFGHRRFTFAQHKAGA
jgi:putative flippase GtrA